jgi:hypothetical protein
MTVLLSASAQGNAATIMCLGCGVERRITKAQWITDEGDLSVFTSPPCVCGTQTTFCWHDEIYVSRREVREVIGMTKDIDDPTKDVEQVAVQVETFPDHEHHNARQMAGIATIAQALGRKQRKLPERRPTGKYAQEPKPPDSDSVKVYLAALAPQIRERIIKDNPQIKERLRERGVKV